MDEVQPPRNGAAIDVRYQISSIFRINPFYKYTPTSGGQNMKEY